jgi:hypothetical protein
MADQASDAGEDTAVAVLRFQTGAIGVIEANYHAPPGSFDDFIEAGPCRGRAGPVRA